MRVAWIVAVLVACGSSSKPPPVEPAPAPPPVAPAPPAKATFPGIPATVAGEHLAWILDAVANKQGVVAMADVTKRMHPTFLAQVPAEKFVEVSKQLVALAPIEVKAADGNELALVAKLSTSQGALVAIVRVDEATKQVVGLLFKPDMDALPKPKTFEEALDMTGKLAPKAQLLVAALDKGTCKPLHATASKDQLAIGSAFKLWVLIALADKVSAGKAKWTDELAVRDDWKSPPGPVNDDAAGTKLTLETFAERMISVSDNAATDHLLYTLGRKPVEAAMRATKHAAPARNIPFLATRELTVMKLNLSEDELAKYVKLPEAQRRKYLDTTLAPMKPDVAKADAWTGPRHVDDLEWFANTTDLCRTMAVLQQRGQKDERVFAVLSKNPGLEVDKAAFPFVGFKGGGEPGVMNMTWLLRRKDDRWFVVVLTANSTTEVIDTNKTIGVAQGVLELVKALP